MSANPTPDQQRVDDLIDEIRQAARLKRAMPDARTSLAHQADGSGLLDFYLAELARLSQPRSELPARLRRFPWSLAPVRKLALRAYNLLTHQQRASNVLVRDALSTLQATLTRNEAALRETAVLTDYVRALLLSARSPSATGGPQGKAPDEELAEFYVALEDQFRGSRELVKERLSVYLPVIRAAALTGPAVDLGCGRGEWMELMKDAGVRVMGVDSNPALVAECRNKGLHVIDADLQTFLEQSPSGHWQIITAFHVIEHLGWPAWLDCLRHIHRGLAANGMAILETPNPANLFTAANRFYLDPTHRHPLPEGLVEFAAKSVGFQSVEILHLHPEDASLGPVDLTGGGAALIRRLTGAQDYAVIARKSALQ
jgi:2-polyprenyl-3-methyl-5-hydroxy-6-metoxy-1,4-benzoquinol methylase